MFEPKIKKMNWFVQYVLTWNWARGITLAPFGIYIKEKYIDIPYIIAEEKIHWMQQKEVYAVTILLCLITQAILLFYDTYAWWLLIFVVIPFATFYIWYFIEWIIKVITPPKGSYYDIGFEREARSNRFDDDYYLTREHFAWLDEIIKI